MQMPRFDQIGRQSPSPKVLNVRIAVGLFPGSPEWGEKIVGNVASDLKLIHFAYLSYSILVWPGWLEMQVGRISC